LNKYQLYTLIGKILALDSFPLHKETLILELRKVSDWGQFVSMADQHLVLQVLFPKLKDNKLYDNVPAEVYEHLKFIFELTVKRNLEIIKQSEHVNNILLKSGISALFMKGVGNIADGVYKYPGERILHDIDILVHDDLFEKTADILLADGYKTNYQYLSGKKHLLKHYPILFKPGEPVYLEIHRMAARKVHSKYFNNDMIFRDSRQTVSIPGFLVMSDEHKMIHNFIHAQYDHYSRIYARESMRNLYDLLLLSTRKDPEASFSGFGHYRRATCGYLDICYSTFGLAPQLRKYPFLFLHTYRRRHYLNLRYRFIGISSTFLIRIFLSFILKPVKAITDKEIRAELMGKIFLPDWYKKQFRYFSKPFRKS